MNILKNLAVDYFALVKGKVKAKAVTNQDTNSATAQGTCHLPVGVWLQSVALRGPFKERMKEKKILPTSTC